MSTQASGPARKASTGIWVLILVVLLPAVVVPLWVPLYDRTDPTLWGFPFFYWFQFALIVVSAVLTSAAFALSRVAERQDRRAGEQAER
jgi:hypothetical protein